MFALAGCGSHIYHFVEPGETLYSISWTYGHDYREVAKWNQLNSPYLIKRGQRLQVAMPASNSGASTTRGTSNKHNKNNKVGAVRGAHKETIRNADKSNKTNIRSKAGERNGHINSAGLQHQRLPQRENAGSFKWQWPTKRGTVIQTFDASDPGKKGLDVAGSVGQPIYSAASGRVVYSGGGLTRYGRLIIVKHNETYLSAYAHNKRLLVKEGELLKSGQLIAEMGSTGTTNTKLHFEIRRNGKPVDPLRYLPREMQ